MAFLSNDEISKIGFKYVGKGVKISDKANFYGIELIEIHDNSRIDDFSILSAGSEGIFIGRHVHIACYASLIGKERIEVQDFCGISSRVSIYSSNDDYSGDWLTGPTVPEKYTNVRHGKVLLEKHVIIGVGSCILPDVTIHADSAVGAFSLVTKNIKSGIIVTGVPAVKLRSRKDTIFKLENHIIK